MGLESDLQPLAPVHMRAHHRVGELRRPPRQPFLHDLVTVLAAPTQVLSARDGSLDGTGRATAEGVLHADVRVLSRVSVEVDGLPGEHVATADGARTATFTTLLRHVGVGLSTAADPQVRLDRDGWPAGDPQVFIDLNTEGLNPDGAVIDAEGDGRITYVNATLANWLGIDLATFRPGRIAMDDIVTESGLQCRTEP